MNPGPSLIFLARLGDAVDDLVEDLVLDIEPRSGAAALAMVKENRTRRAGNGGLEVRIGEDDVGRLASQLQRDLLKVSGCGLHDQLADLG